MGSQRVGHDLATAYQMLWYTLGIQWPGFALRVKDFGPQLAAMGCTPCTQRVELAQMRRRSWGGEWQGLPEGL